MKQCRETMWLLVAVCVLMPAGCASQRGRFAKKHQVNTAQLLAAARQYEKEGHIQNAAHIYKHVLTYHPTNAQAKQGLALVQQGKLRVDYDTQQLLASTDPTIQNNPQARELLAQQQKVERDQVTEQMAQIIAAAAADPQKIEVDSSPTPMMVASLTTQPAAHATAQPQPSQSQPSQSQPSQSQPSQPQPSQPEPSQPQLVILGPSTSHRTTKAEPQTIAHAAALSEGQFADPIETTAFTESGPSAAGEEQTPADWSADSPWRPHTLTRFCQDANAAVLREVGKLDSHVDEVRKDGLRNLAHMGAEAASAGPAIRQLLADKNQLVAAHAAWAAWEVERDASSVVETLVKLLDSPSTDVIQFAAYTLASMGQPANSAAPQMRELLTHQQSITRLHAAEALIHISGPAERQEAVDTLIILLKDEETEVRSLAAMMLGVAYAENADAAVASLVTALDDQEAHVRAAAALSLGAYGDQADFAVEKLREVVQWDRTDVREAAETALSCIQL